MNVKEREHDDLTVIKGIGPARQQWLQDSLNVRTFHDLSTLTVAEIETRLKAEGQIASPTEIEQWLIQAGELAEAAGQTPAAEGEWEWLKAFVVEFCIRRTEEQIQQRELRVYPLKVSRKGDWLDNGETRRRPITFERGTRLYPWMVEQLNEPAWQEPEAEPPPQFETPPVEASRAQVPAPGMPPLVAPTIEVKQLAVFQPLQAEVPAIVGRPGRPFTGFITGGEPFAVEATFALAGTPAAKNGSGRTACWANFYVRNMATGSSTSLGDTEVNELSPEETVHKLRLPEITLPPGRYHLGVQVMLRTQPPAARHLEVPFFEIL